jgi:GTP 3',8-cyclase
MPLDQYRRKIDYLRLSVTDRCNLRCVYCLPEDYAFPATEKLSDEELAALARTFVSLGFTKIRLTGGEPLLRRELARFVSMLPPLEDLALSTNGVLLAEQAEGLARAGVRRVNISLDTLDAEKFRRLTRFGRLEDVWSGIEKALASGMSPVKLNVVVVRGQNDGEVAEFARLTEKQPLHVRFIELMPMGETGYFSLDRLVPMKEILERAGSLEALPLDEKPTGHGPARYFRRPGARGTVGIISAMSCNFCENCNRVRLSSSGVLVPCLDGDDGVDLAAPLRAGAGEARIRELILDTLAHKPERHKMEERAADRSENPRFMCQIGG